MSLTSKHFFCGGGGDTTGLARAGFTPVFAANHDPVSIETHSANFPDCDHLVANLEHVEMRRLPRTDVLWASPICTEISPAGGSRRRRREQSSLFDEKPLTDANFDRTRVTALTIIAAAEVHRYDVVMGENVVEFGTDWELFDWWVQGMRILGYEFQLINVNAAHIGGPGNPHAPQWRDRLFFIFWRKGIAIPRIQPRPLAPCHTCGDVVEAVQWWKDAKKSIGKYRMQYLYRCPNARCRHQIVEPFVRPAADILDFTHVGARIGDRKRPLAPNTLRRIEAGLAKFSRRQSMVTLNHGGHDGRVFLPEEQPLPARSTKIGEGLLTPPLLVPCGGTRNDTAWPTNQPMRTLLCRDAEAVVTPPFYVKHYSVEAGQSVDHLSKSVLEPLGTVTVSDHHSLVIPPAFVAELRRHGTARPVVEPLSTITSGGNHHALVTGDAPAVEDCHLRMVQPREQFLAQAFPPDYVLRGNKSQQTAQAGNAVPVNVAQWIGEQVYAALETAGAR